MVTLASLPAIVTFQFPATFAVAGMNVRWETLIGAVAVFLVLLVALSSARGTPVDLSVAADWPSPRADIEGPNHLRADDLLYIAVAALPGALAGGRLGYALIHLDYYGANPGALLDVTRGGLELSMGVVGGAITASIVVLLLGAPLGRWLHALAIPLLMLLALVKVAMVFGGSGQGVPSDFSLATQYVGPGPWGSLAPGIPSLPSQAMEALGTVLAGGVAWYFAGVGMFRRRNGAAFFLAVGLWALVRALVAATWRDPAVVWTLSAAQVLALGLAIACALVVVGFAAAAAAGQTRSDDEHGEEGDGGDDALAWPAR